MVVVILVLGILFIRRERRKLAALREHPIDTTQNHGRSGELDPTVSLPVPPQPSRMPPFARIAGVPADPVDLSVTSPRSSLFSPFIPSSSGLRRSQSNGSRHGSIRTKSTIGSPNSRPLVDLDIAGLLEVASVKHQEGDTETRPNPFVEIPAVPPPSLSSSLKVNRLSSGWKRSHRDQDVPLSHLGSPSGVSPATRGPSVMAQDTRVATPKTDELSSQGASSISSRDAGARSQHKTPVRF